MPPQPDHARRARARELRMAGYSRSQIARELGVKTGGQALDRWLRGLPPPAWTRRPRANDEAREKAVALRREGKSYREIQEVVGVSQATLSLWLRSVPLTKAQKEALRERTADALKRAGMAARRRALERDLRIAREATTEISHLDDRELFLVGVVAYWAEGGKNKPWRRGERVSFANSDPGLVKLFLRWLGLLGVERDRLVFRIQIHESADIQAAQRHWARILSVEPPTSLRVTLKRHNPRTVRKNVGDGYHGCLSIDVRSSVELNRRIEGWFQGIVRLLHKGAGDGHSWGRGLLPAYLERRSGVV